MLPFIKWLGGKRKLAAQIEAMFGEVNWKYTWLHVPFLGAGGFTFHVQAENVIANDIDRPLMAMYKGVMNSPTNVQVMYDALMSSYLAVEDIPLRKKLYYQRRTQFNQLISGNITVDDVFAGLYIFMNKAGFNGLMRYNNSGGFNTPYGNHSSYQKELLVMEHADVMSGWHIHNEDFEIMMEAREGDKVYCDPPYLKKFSKYSKKDFKPEDHMRLSLYMSELKTKKVDVVTSGSDTDLTRNIYRHHNIHVVNSSTSVGAKKGRGKNTELLITNF